MKVINKMRFMPMTLVLLLIIMMAVPMTQAEAYTSPATVNLNSASSFAVLAGSAITNTGPTKVGGSAGGNIGLYPNTVSSITGLEVEGVTVTGNVYTADGVAGQAKTDLQTAYTDAAGRTPSTTISSELGETTLTPGVYTSDPGTFEIAGTLTLDAQNNPNAVFIFQMETTLTTASGSRIVLINDAQACNVFWQVGSSATLGTNSTFVGHILASESITATTGAAVQGQLLALGGAVTLDSNTITNNDCLAPGSLRVSKVVEGPVSGMILDPFEITITRSDNAYSDTQIIAAGNDYTWTGLNSGTYMVSEKPLGEAWSVSGILPQGYTVEIGQITDVTVTNTYTPPTSNGSDDSTNDNDNDAAATTGQLTVRKAVSGEIGDLTLPAFTITVTGPSDFSATRTILRGESYTWENLVPGTYTVTESRTGLSTQWTVSGEGSVEVTADQTALATITNAYNPGVVVPGVTPTTGSPDETTTPEEIDLSTITRDEDDTPVLGFVELPRTGGNPFVMVIVGFALSGMGLLLRKKESSTKAKVNN